MARRWKNRPPGAAWGRFGDQDRIGRLNLLDPAAVLRAVAEVREGRVFCLSLPLDFPGGRVLAPHRFPPELAPTERHGERYHDYSFSNEGAYCDVGCDDSVHLCTQYSTQWDALSHIGQRFDADGDGVAEACYYNGLSAAELGIEHMAATGLQGRGVLVDLEAAFGRARRVVGYAELMTAMEADGATVEPGDILCLHTGFADVVLGMERRPDAKALREACAVLDGTDERLLDWIRDSGIAAIAADNYAVEGLPPRARPGVHPFVPLHAHCLFKLGIPLGELWYLTELAAWLKSRRRTRFLLTAPPLRLPGAAGSPVTPVATV